jgi:NAD(P)H-hydrate epimerase
MIAVTGEEMKAIDNYCIEKLGIPGIVLMENAALKVVSNIDLNRFNSFTILCGVGNNGGDGLAVARHLIVENKKVDIFILGNIDKSSQDFMTNYNILRNMKFPFRYIKDKGDLDILKESLFNSDMVIDSVFGTGLSREVEGIFKDVFSLVNQKGKYILSIDIPSGINSDTGKVMGIAINPHETITFQLMKKGLVNNKSLSGYVIVETIGMPKVAIDGVL